MRLSTNRFLLTVFKKEAVVIKLDGVDVSNAIDFVFYVENVI